MSLGPRLLVIDDSAVVREMVARLFRLKGGWSVDVAADPVLALEVIRKQPPDVILLDLEMPRMDGLTLLRHLNATAPIPVVVCSAHADRESAKGAEALALGAVEVIPKGAPSATASLDAWSDSILTAIERAVGTEPPRQMPKPRGVSVASNRWTRPVLIGASIGGPEAVRRVVSAFPGDGPPCVIVQHMPSAYTEGFARRLNRQVAMSVETARDGDRLSSGRALVAPGGFHLVLRAATDGVRVRLADAPPVAGHRPSIDVLFQSAAETLGARAVAALLTGMGSDGAQGMLALRRGGASTLAQDETTSVVFGMPRSAIALGAADWVLPLRQIGEHVLALARRPGEDLTRRVP